MDEVRYLPVMHWIFLIAIFLGIPLLLSVWNNEYAWLQDTNKRISSYNDF